jgi:hypothetical protein
LSGVLSDLGVRTIEPAFPGWHAAPALAADPAQTKAARQGPDLSRFFHLYFDSADAALAALPEISAQPAILLAQPIPSGLEWRSFPDDPYFLPSSLYGADAQWCLLNRGVRTGGDHCGPAVAGGDLRVSRVWEDYFQGSGSPPDGSGSIGSPSVVIGLFDSGILAHHPDLHVLTEFTHDPRFTFCPEYEWCGDHGTKMAGLAAMATNNGIGAAGVCGDCALLDLRIPGGECSDCGDIYKPGHPNDLWYTKFASALPVPLGMAPDGQQRRLVVVNASFNSVGVASLEEIEAVWSAHLAGVLTVGAAGWAPGGIPFVLAVGGSTWEDRFWDASTTCYYDNNGTEVGPGLVDLAAPASGYMLTAFPAENPGGGGLYAWTGGGISGATALVSGACGLLQSYAHDRSPLRRDLAPDDLAGLLTATTRPYSADPTSGAPCPLDSCPRSFYGTGIASVENAIFTLAHADAWREVFVSLTDGCDVEFRPPEFIDTQRRRWREYEITWDFSLQPRPDLSGAPDDLPRFIAWSLRVRSTTPCSYPCAVGPCTWVGAGDRILYAESGITDCSVELDRETGIGRLTGANFVEVKDGTESPLVPWNEVRMGMVVWSPRVEGAPRPVRPVVSMAGPNPFRETTHFRVKVNPGADVGVDVVDVGGRVVRVLRAGPSDTGVMDLLWDGKNNQGRVVPAGVYWIRVRSEGKLATRPIVRVS